MPHVISSALRFVDYDDEAAVLSVTFRHGGQYRYFDVPRSVYVGLLEAPSKGTYFDAKIRDVYRFARDAAGSRRFRDSRPMR